MSTTKSQFINGKLLVASLLVLLTCVLSASATWNPLLNNPNGWVGIQSMRGKFKDAIVTVNNGITEVTMVCYVNPNIDCYRVAGPTVEVWQDISYPASGPVATETLTAIP